MNDYSNISTTRVEVLVACADQEYAKGLCRQLQRKYADRIILSTVDSLEGVNKLLKTGYIANVMLTEDSFLAEEKNSGTKKAGAEGVIAKAIGLLVSTQDANDTQNAARYCISKGIQLFEIDKYSGAERIVKEVCRIYGETGKQISYRNTEGKYKEELPTSEEDLYAIVPILREEVSNKIDYSGNITDEDVLSKTDEVLSEMGTKEKNGLNKLTDEQKRWLETTVFNSIKKLDILQPLIEDHEITEIMINGYGTIFVERNSGMTMLKRGFESQKRFSDIIQKMVSEVNKIINEFSPIVDLHLKDGSRVNIVLPPVAPDGPVMTIRKFPESRYSIDDLVALNMMPEKAAEAICDLVQARYNIFISGGTGTGKTTLLNALASEIPEDQRVITIEDAAELKIKNIPNLVRLETKSANAEQRGAVRMEQLIRTSLRMRPDRIIVGEVRGEEVFSMLQAMNTGHDGSLSTGHANSARDMITRLEAMALMSVDIPLSSVRKQIVSAIDILIHITRDEDGIRKVSEISELVTVESNGKEGVDIAQNRIFESADGVLKRTGNNFINREKLCLYGLGKKEWIKSAI